MSTVIKVENLSKQYRLGTIGTGTLSHDVNRWWHKIRGKEDPYLKVSQINDRTQKGSGDYVWALRDMNFEIQQGDIVGIIGRNGAGKSTLLKILSRTTLPTTGAVKVKGRIASLLEVGTGFHPELTGRENIFLNGAILGMRKAEIKSKLDEIVDFAGVEKYIDTPVKRYSSGMYVRLAFAVAAHLDPEILIVDEVLAVGDAEFQKKALGKMKSVSAREGRTVLFVSHNMGAIQALCNQGIFLKNGLMVMQSSIDSIIAKYLKGEEVFQTSLADRTDREGNGKFKFTNLKFKDRNDGTLVSVFTGGFVKIVLEYECLLSDFDPKHLIISIDLKNDFNQSVASFVSDEMNKDFLPNGDNKIELVIDRLMLRGGDYSIRLFLAYESTLPSQHCDVIENAAELKVLSNDYWIDGKIIRATSGAVIDAGFKIYS